MSTSRRDFLNTGAAAAAVTLAGSPPLRANSEGTDTTQAFFRVGPSFNATATGAGGFQQFSEELAPCGAGWECSRRYNLIIDPTNLWLTIHESIGHPTELDRAMGFGRSSRQRRRPAAAADVATAVSNSSAAIKHRSISLFHAV